MSKHQIGVAAIAANVSVARIHKLLERGTIKLRSNDRPATGTGTCHLFSRQRVIQVALTQKLIDLGLAASQAANVALQFTDPPASCQASPCIIPTVGRLMLAGLPGGQVKIATIPPDSSLDDLVNNEPAAFVINLSKIVNTVDAHLNS